MFQFRIEATNVFNIVNLINPGTNLARAGDVREDPQRAEHAAGFSSADECRSSLTPVDQPRRHENSEEYEALRVFETSWQIRSRRICRGCVCCLFVSCLAARGSTIPRRATSGRWRRRSISSCSARCRHTSRRYRRSIHRPTACSAREDGGRVLVGHVHARARGRAHSTQARRHWATATSRRGSARMGLIEARAGSKAFSQMYAALALQHFGENLDRNAVWQAAVAEPSATSGARCSTSSASTIPSTVASSISPRTTSASPRAWRRSAIAWASRATARRSTR